MKNILLTTDFSRSARNAAIYAINLFGDEAVKYTFLNALDSRITLDKLGTNEDKLRTISLIEIKKEITFLNDYFPNKNLNFQPYFMMDSVTNAIKTLNDIESFDFIVAGTKNENTKRWILGSTAKKISQSSPVPVLLIPEMVRYKKISTVLFVTDLKLDESFLIHQAINFTIANKASMTILNIDQDDSESPSNSSFIKIRELAVNSEYDSIKFEKVVEPDIENAINKYVSNNDVDLLSMITYTTTLFKKWFHQSLTAKITKHSKIPLLIYNRKEFDLIFLG